MPAYMIFIREGEVRDPDAMAAYRAAPRAKGHKIKPLAAYGDQVVLEGEAPDGIVILEFETVEAAKAWYDSPEYREASKLRRQAGDYRTLIVEGLEPPRG